MKSVKDYHDNGQVLSERFYDSNDSEVAIIAYYMNGQTAYHFNLMNGRKYGLCQYWNMNGTPRYAKIFSDDVEVHLEDGVALVWDTIAEGENESESNVQGLRGNWLGVPSYG